MSKTVSLQRKMLHARIWKKGGGRQLQIRVDQTKFSHFKTHTLENRGGPESAHDDAISTISIYKASKFDDIPHFRIYWINA